MKRLAIAAMLLGVAASAGAATIRVGPARTLTTLAEAAAAARTGDSIVIDRGVYASGAVWNGDWLRIAAAPGLRTGDVVVRGGTVEGKALFVVTGDNVSIAGIRFENAVVPDANGAGIRGEGRNLTVRDCAFAGNEMGMLAGGPADANVLRVTGSLFDANHTRAAGGLGHQLYVGANIAGLVAEGNVFVRGERGHAIKSRARSTVIRGNIIDDRDGGAAYLIDIPDGGGALIEDNDLIKGPRPSNCCTAIAYGFEMAGGAAPRNPPGAVIVRHNRLRAQGIWPVRLLGNRSEPHNPARITGDRHAWKYAAHAAIVAVLMLIAVLALVRRLR